MKLPNSIWCYIAAGHVVGGGSTMITLESATDPDGSVANYQYEHKVDGGTYEVFSTVNALTTEEEINADWGTCSIGSINAEEGTVAFTIPTTAVLSISKYVMDTPV